MANVNIKFNNKDYLLSCDDGQEEDLKTLTKFLDKKYSSLKEKLGNIGENKLLLITSIQVIDEYFDLKQRVQSQKENFENLSKKFKEMRSLAIDYKGGKDKEILKESSFGMLGCICLNSIRQIKKPIGGLKIGVIGAGVLGNITAQILLSYGANVSIFDPNLSKGSIFEGKKGIKFFSDRDQFINSKNSLNQGKGFDAVIIACGVKDNAPLLDALEVIIENGEIVVLGLSLIHI